VEFVRDMTKIVGYRRLSPTGASEKDQKAKLRKQKVKIEEHCESNDKELVKLYTANGASARKKAPEEREVFSGMLDDIRENEDIEEIVVHHTDRITRQAISRVALLQIVRAAVGRHVDIYSTSEEMYVKYYTSLEEVSAGEFFAKVAEGFSSQSEKQKEAQKVTEVLQDKKAENKPIGKQPRGITTDKQRDDYDSDEATIRLPGDGFEKCIEILNEFATTEKSAYAIGNDFGLSSPTRAVKGMWERRERYREATENSEEEWNVEF
jgi:DNA invertase Pin-like site-specific DNA recombinase